MKRFLFALPLAGTMMMTAPLAFAQSAPPTGNDAPTAAVEEQQDMDDAARGDCVDLSSAVAPTKSARELHDSLDDAAPDHEASAEETASADTDDVESAGSESETQPVAGADSGTAPGGSGSTGWTGGLGGSDIGTSQSEELDSSPQQNHPQVASGLDPISGETAIQGPQAPSEPDEDAAVTPTAPDEDEMASADC
ncbi:hypothetical protein [Mesorhizobium sp. CAU 1741]|uniref:hypothetical protein n=1 Tax=Mesorhizobium sp. CAU 1741 TaxID=3140366 RepID=UPI00325BBF94